MELLEAMKARRSIRKFKSDPIPESQITQLIESARLAPSGSNLQPTRFVVIKSETARAQLSEATPLPFVSQAPVIIACCIDTESLSGIGTRARELMEAGAFKDTPLEKMDTESYAKRRPMDQATAEAYLRLNAAIAIDHITLRAVDLGLGTCWVMMFDQEKVKQILGLGENYNVVALLPVGYPDQDPNARPRIELSQILLKEV
ncbi:nitroreductase family protein [Desulfosporosinus meridiei]|uniref:Nitroreductase n=1 Tax=Desulfosporosinus meridiei (strain ATCC BAA-275 / DSM 13257 / KCTC 12902 / NCIMB 13706 / S10) TaxID=768704 RepID=J7IKZ8_DESMD|nr:nitroreductase family protein [Desulfosporosinus meridiei]AFQ42462.1 nitroreductase [Desulfosporosinus meridiei DSM 13257]